MGTLVPTTMRPALLLLALTFAITAEVSQAFSIDRQPFQVERRGYRDPDDPRNLFAAMYGGNYKRSGSTNNQLGDYDHQLGASPIREACGIGTTRGTCSVLSMEASFAAEIFKTLRSKIENDSILDFFLIKLKLTQTVKLL